jgi:putative ABC transport system permease protein
MHDIRYTARLMRKDPGFTGLIILTLGLGIGANSALFSVVDAVLLKALPYRDPDRLVMVWERNPGLSVEKQRVSPGNLLDWQNRNHVFEGLAYWPAWTGSREFNLLGPGGPERLRGSYTSSGLFPVLGVRPVLGRTFLPDDDRREGPATAILSYELWQRSFGGDPEVIGRSLTIDSFDRRHYQVIGVMPRGFGFPDGCELWLPAGWMGISMDRRTAAWLEVIARLRPGVSLERAQRELDGIQGQIAREYTDSRISPQVALVPLLDHAVGPARQTLLILLGTVAFVLLIACTNVASLLLARGAARQHELAIRSAVGASRARILRQLLFESLVLGLLGGGFGVLLAFWGVRLLRVFGPQDIPRLAQASMDMRALGFTLVLSLVAGALCGLTPAWQLSRYNLGAWLKEGNSAGSRRLGVWRDFLIVGETALAMVLLVGAGLMVHSLWRLEQVDPGFRPHGLVTANLDLSSSRYSNSGRSGPNRPQVFTRRLLEQIRSLSGVDATAAASGLPPTAASLPETFAIDGRTYHNPNEYPVAFVRAVTPGYFRAMGIPLLRGRTFTDRDIETAPQVAIINETLARRYFPNGEDPLGRRFDLGIRRDKNGRAQPWWQQIIGVVGDVKNAGLALPNQPEIYKPDMQWAWHWAHLVIRTDNTPAAMAVALRDELGKLSKEQSVPRVIPLEQVLAGERAQPRFRGMLLGMFAALALLLASVGIYGVMSYAVARRTSEIGIRMALGANRADISWLVVRRALKLVLAGATLGMAGAAVLSRLISTVLFEVSPLDPVTFLATPLFLLAVALLATWLPARHAARVDPLRALRFE